MRNDIDPNRLNHLSEEQRRVAQNLLSSMAPFEAQQFVGWLNTPAGGLPTLKQGVKNGAFRADTSAGEALRRTG